VASGTAAGFLIFIVVVVIVIYCIERFGGWGILLIGAWGERWNGRREGGG
jgi:uncharacterized protein HemY